MRLDELQRIAKDGERFTLITNLKRHEHDCQWLDIRRGLFLLGEKKIECDVKGAPHVEVRRPSANSGD